MVTVRYTRREWRYVQRQRRLLTVLEWQPQEVLRQLCEDAEYIVVQPPLKRYGDEGYTAKCKVLARAVLGDHGGKKAPSLFTLLPIVSNVSKELASNAASDNHRLVPWYCESYGKNPLEFAFVHNVEAFCTASRNFCHFFTLADDARRRRQAISSIIDAISHCVPRPFL